MSELMGDSLFFWRGSQRSGLSGGVMDQTEMETGGV